MVATSPCRFDSMPAYLQENNGKIEISVRRLLGRDSAWTSDQGQAVYDVLLPYVESQTPVRLSFAEVDLITPTFLNAAVGQLCSSHTPAEIKEIVEMQRVPSKLLYKCLDNAVIYFERRKK